MSRIGMPAGHRPRCLGAELSAYADRTLPAAELSAWDRHLIACMSCRQHVDTERRMLSSLRTSSCPDLPGDLRSMLLSLAAGAQEGPSQPEHQRPVRMPVAPVPVVERGAPALHRSAVRATLFAGLAAGASAAAAWSFAVSGSGITSPAPASPSPGAAVERARPVGATFSTSLTSRSLSPTGQVAVLRTGSAPVVSGVRHHSAQSTP
jgi:anti-sigma factor RsiW